MKRVTIPRDVGSGVLLVRSAGGVNVHVGALSTYEMAPTISEPFSMSKEIIWTVLLIISKWAMDLPVGMVVVASGELLLPFCVAALLDVT